MNEVLAPRLRVLIADDFPPLRRRLAEAFAEIPGLIICGEAGTVSEALRLTWQLQPQVLVTDLHFPDGTAIEVLEVLAERLPALVVVVLTLDPNPELRTHALGLGADAFFDKSRDLSQAVQFLRGLAQTT
jgi:DNA-binding NarL/FixJ family response regulator